MRLTVEGWGRRERERKSARRFGAPRYAAAMSSSDATRGAWYEEWNVAPALRKHVACVWAAQLGAAGERHVERVIPDGCIDVLFTEGELTIAGPDTESVELPALENRSFVGVRFRAGVGSAALNVSASALADQRIPARDVLGASVSRLSDQLAAAASARDAGRRLEAAAATWLRARAPDALVAGAVSALRAPGADWTVRSLADVLGVGERQLRRRFVAAVGYGPKTLERILRLRRFIASARAAGTGLAALALDAGYADQSHLTRECRELAGCTPTQLLGYPVTAA